ncbi:DegT/DnrJ/EryC1/StrS family aminotransferase [Candidatus Pelagibacter sp. Uisw_130]|uniref:DegT/DnrJ/EryC1/StrS family aminotransferase n=1 Tax=Candidatus Pelagibacter sp. Uisw_130 TaxID=3230989 RepID=UPI0039EA932A
MKITQIQPWINSDEANYIKKIVQKKYLTESKETEKFEKYFQKNFKVSHAIAISNWTCGIFACLKALNIGKNDEVIVPNLTFVATLNAVLMCGANPVLCEVSQENLSLDLNDLKKNINNKTKAIIPVHLYGHCCDMRQLIKISKIKKIPIIEDAAQSIYSTYNKKLLGTLGLMGGFSFYGNKIITTGEGGIVLTKSKKLRDKVYQIKNHGRLKKGIFKHATIGFNFMFTELQAAIGNIQVKKLKKILNKKEEIYKEYKKKLSVNPEISFMKKVDGNVPVYWFSNIFVKNKEKLKAHLIKHKIQTRDIFYPLNMQPCYKNNKNIKNLNKKFNVSKKIYDTGLSLPSSYELKIDEQEFVIKKILEFFKKN